MELSALCGLEQPELEESPWRIEQHLLWHQGRFALHTQQRRNAVMLMATRAKLIGAIFFFLRKKATWTCAIPTLSNYMHKVVFPKAAFEKIPCDLKTSVISCNSLQTVTVCFREKVLCHVKMCKAFINEFSFSGHIHLRQFFAIAVSADKSTYFCAAWCNSSFSVKCPGFICDLLALSKCPFLIWHQSQKLLAKLKKKRI